MTSSKKYFKASGAGVSQSLAAEDKMFKTISSKCAAEEDIVFVSVKKARPQKLNTDKAGAVVINKVSRNLTTFNCSENKHSLLRIESRKQAPNAPS